MEIFKNLPNELVNHIYIYCQGRTNQIMKQHIHLVDRYKDPYEELYSQAQSQSHYHSHSHLINVLRLMEYYGHTYFEKNKFHSRFYRCTNCNRIGSSEPYMAFDEKFCCYTCADVFDY